MSRGISIDNVNGLLFYFDVILASYARHIDENGKKSVECSMAQDGLEGV